MHVVVDSCSYMLYMQAYITGLNLYEELYLLYAYDPYFAESLRVSALPSPPILRGRLDMDIHKFLLFGAP